MEPSYWKCICSSCVSKESAYLMLTSWDLACKQTWSPLLCLRITTNSHGWVKEETERKEGRWGERKEKKGVWREEMRWSQWYSWSWAKKSGWKVRLLSKSKCVFPGGRFDDWYSKLKVLFKKINLMYHIFSFFFFFFASFLSLSLLCPLS